VSARSSCSMVSVSRNWWRAIRATARTAIFFLKIYPMFPSRPVDWVTRRPVRELVRYPTLYGQAEGHVYRPSGSGRHPGMVVCLGVVPFGVEHPQVPRLGEALARSGFAALLYWSPPRDRLAEDVKIALAYDCHQTIRRSCQKRSSGTCVEEHSR
jgi:hypothetical protein